MLQQDLPLRHHCRLPHRLPRHHRDHIDSAEPITTRRNDASVVRAIRAIPRWTDRDGDTIIWRGAGQQQLSDVRE